MAPSPAPCWADGARSEILGRAPLSGVARSVLRLTLGVLRIAAMILGPHKTAMAATAPTSRSMTSIGTIFFHVRPAPGAVPDPTLAAVLRSGGRSARGGRGGAG